MSIPPFHLAFPVLDLVKTRAFYADLLECSVGRESDAWIDFNFYGHQITAHLKPEELAQAKTNAVDGKNVPVRHFGAILDWDAWHQLAARLEKAGSEFIIDPYIRFKGEVGEQATMFISDPSGNGLEFKAFKDTAQIFAK